MATWIFEVFWKKLDTKGFYKAYSYSSSLPPKISYEKHSFWKIGMVKVSMDMRFPNTDILKNYSNTPYVETWIHKHHLKYQTSNLSSNLNSIILTTLKQRIVFKCPFWALFEVFRLLACKDLWWSKLLFLNGKSIIRYGFQYKSNGLDPWGPFKITLIVYLWHILTTMDYVMVKANWYPNHDFN